jgi:Ca-activated chloride channel family protein
MAELQLLRPVWLLGLIPLLIVWWWLWYRKERSERWQRVVEPHLLAHLLVGEKGSKGLKPIHLLLLVWLLAAMAMAAPSWRMAASPFEADNGLVVLLKTASTMVASDVQPSRLERAKHKLRDLLAERRGKSTGLIVYSGSAHLVMPLTRDERVIPIMLEDLTPELMPVDGDALSEGLELARSLLNRAGTSGSMLVIADSVSPAQSETLLPRDHPVQFLSLQPPGASQDQGLKQAASALGAIVERLTADEVDVTRIARRAETRHGREAALADGQRAEDGGYFLLPFIMLLALFWSRRGWLLR